jgi:hypothetical protein
MLHSSQVPDSDDVRTLLTPTLLRVASCCRLFLPAHTTQLHQLFSACGAHLTRLQLHAEQNTQKYDWDMNISDLNISRAALPAQLGLLTSLRCLQLGHHGQQEEGWWLVPSVAPLQGLSGK